MRDVRGRACGRKTTIQNRYSLRRGRFSSASVRHSCSRHHALQPPLPPPAMPSTTIPVPSTPLKKASLLLHKQQTPLVYPCCNGYAPIPSRRPPCPQGQARPPHHLPHERVRSQRHRRPLPFLVLLVKAREGQAHHRRDSGVSFLRTRKWGRRGMCFFYPLGARGIACVLF